MTPTTHLRLPIASRVGRGVAGMDLGARSARRGVRFEGGAVLPVNPVGIAILSAS
jgi:hypothetical protein